MSLSGSSVIYSVGARWCAIPGAAATQPSASTPLPESTESALSLAETIEACCPLNVEPKAWRVEAAEALATLQIPPDPPFQPSTVFKRLSVLAFVLVYTWLLNWQMAVILLGLIFFHELGHKLLMQAFGYHDVQMYFIPFFGAAVSGIKENATQVQRALVALAGPLPGIVLTCAALLPLWWRGQYIHDPLLLRTAELALLLNGLNLLPFVPLDGGRFFSAILYSRNPLLETACKLIAAAAFLLGGYGLGAWPLYVIGAFILITTPTTHRIAVLARRLRHEGVLQEGPIHELPLGPLLHNYATIREALPDNVSIGERVNLLRRAYASALTPPASLGASIALVALFAFGIVALGMGLWCLVATIPPPPPEYLPVKLVPAE